MGFIQQTLITKSGLCNTFPLSYLTILIKRTFMVLFKKIIFHKDDNPLFLYKYYRRLQFTQS